MSLDELKETIDQANDYLESLYDKGCSNHGCIYRQAGGVGTNGMCQCGKNSRIATQELHGRYYRLRQKVEAIIECAYS